MGSDTTTFCGSEMDNVRRIALEKLFGKISEVASFPATAQKILELTNQPEVDGDQVRETIQTDPALVANLLRRVNSGFYALPNKVADVKTAVSLLGFKEIRNLAMTVFLSRFSEKPSDHGTYKRQNLWNHCVAVGTAARFISKLTKRAVPEEAYVAGLLHDFGYILCDQFLHPHFCKVIDGLNEQTATTPVENSILTFDHAMLGGFVAQKWNFPESAADAIMFHHKPQEYSGPHAETLHVVVLANYLCSQAGYLSLGVNNVAAPGSELLTALKLDEATLTSLSGELQSTLQSAIGIAA
jgi:HD-like signal output (HDOD) protein